MKQFFSHTQTPFCLALVAILLVGCSPDFAALQGTATNEEASTEDDGPIAKAMVVGDAHSPKLADFLGGRNIEVLDVPYTRHAASEIEIDGDYIVWSDNRNGTLDVFGYQISTGDEFPVSTAAGDQKAPQVSGDYVVWEDHRDGNADIYGYQISTKTEFAISTAAQNQLFPQIDADYVVWHDLRDSDADIYAYRISTAETLSVSATPGDGDQWYPKVSGDYIVWQSYLDGFSDIHGYHIPSQVMFPITEKNNSSQFSPEIDGDYVVWVDNSKGHDNIHGYKISTMQLLEITNESTQQWNPRVAGDYVVWQAFKGGSFDINAYQLSTGQPFAPQVATDTKDQILPAVSGDYIVWQDLRNDSGNTGNYDIYAYQISSATTTRVTTDELPQTNVNIDNGNIVWLDQQRGIVDVMHSADLGATQAFATNTWLTPAGVIDQVADYDVIVLASDFVSDAVMKTLFNTAIGAGTGVLGLGGTGTSLAQVLNDDGHRYGVNISTDSGCWEMQVVIDSNLSHPLFARVRLSPVAEFEEPTAVTRDELSITMDASALDKPTDVDIWGYFSNYMCQQAQPALVEFPAGDKGSRVILDGTATIADGYLHWTEDRWDLLFNEVSYLKPVEEE
ncbi:hypothetical protein ACFL2V_13475 [Pseudomonadota bacterium]